MYVAGKSDESDNVDGVFSRDELDLFGLTAKHPLVLLTDYPER